VQADLVESSGGVFEVSVDGKLIFSKKKVGRFPEEAEIFSRLG
jgi:selenoprotein W-related protein